MLAGQVVLWIAVILYLLRVRVREDERTDLFVSESLVESRSGSESSLIDLLDDGSGEFWKPQRRGLRGRSS
jgi:hypothetical protein